MHYGDVVCRKTMFIYDNVVCRKTMYIYDNVVWPTTMSIMVMLSDRRQCVLW